MVDLDELAAVHRPEARAGASRAADELGLLGILVNNAGVTRDNLVFTMSDGWDTVIAAVVAGDDASFITDQTIYVDGGRGCEYPEATGRGAAR